MLSPSPSPSPSLSPSLRLAQVEARKRATERASMPRMQPQRRACLVPPPLASEASISVFAAFEAAFERFEAGVGEAEQSDLPMASLPWPPENVPVSGAARLLTLAPRPSPLALAPHSSPSPLHPLPSSVRIGHACTCGVHSCCSLPAVCACVRVRAGVRRSDSDAARKQRLKKAMLRWHPDKYVAAHASRISEGELAAVVERVTAVMQRVQQERVAYGSAPVIASQDRLPR